MSRIPLAERDLAVSQDVVLSWRVEHVAVVRSWQR